MKVREIMKKEFVKIDSEEKVTKIIKMLEENEVAYVFDGDKYLGAVTKYSILRHKIDVNTEVKKVVTKTPKLNPEDDINKVIKLMIESNFLYLPVFEDKIIGQVSSDEILNYLLNTEISKIKVERLVGEEVILAKEDDPIISILMLMRKNRVSHIPIIDKKGKLAGLVTSHDILDKIIYPRERAKWGEVVGEKIKPLNNPISGIMNPNPITVDLDSNIREVIRKMIEYKVGGIVVVKGDVPVGVITRRDILELALSESNEGLYIQISASGVELGDLILKEIYEEGEKLLRKYQSILGENPKLFIYVKKHKGEFKEKGRYSIRIRLRGKRMFIGMGEGWGVDNALRNALDNLEIILSREKDLEWIKEI